MENKTTEDKANIQLTEQHSQIRQLLEFLKSKKVFIPNPD